jgi:hypothetical protein
LDEQIEGFRPYIRTCHQKILNETLEEKHKHLCSFLRQLLRPHGYRIETVKAGWRLHIGSSGKGIQIKDGKRIDWIE